MIFPFPSTNKCTQFDFLNSYVYCFAFFFRLFLFLHIFLLFFDDGYIFIWFTCSDFILFIYFSSSLILELVFCIVEFSIELISVFIPHKIHFFLSSISFSIIFIYYSKGSSSIATQYPSFQALIFVFLILVKPYSIWNWNDVQKKKEIEIVLQLVRCVYNIK